MLTEAYKSAEMIEFCRLNGLTIVDGSTCNNMVIQGKDGSSLDLWAELDSGSYIPSLYVDVEES